VGTRRQEKVQLVGGRFDFDTIHSIALFDPNWVEIGTEAGGWFRAPRNSLRVRDWQRPNLSEIDLTTVDGVSITRVGETERLCLHRTGGGYVRLARDQALERTQHCLEHLGDDGFWRYAKDGISLTITSRVGSALARHLMAGRFTDDVVLGLPVTGKGGDGVFYLLPTQLGVFRLDSDLNRLDVRAPPFAGFPDGSAPRALFMLDPETPVYAGQGALYPLDVQQPVTGTHLGLPADTPFQMIEDGPQDLVRIGWQAGNERGWDLVERDNLSPLLRNSLLVYLGDFDKFVQHRIQWKDPQPWLQLDFKSNRIDASWLGSDQPFLVRISETFELLTPVIFKQRLLLIGKQELMEVSLERVMVEAASLPGGPNLQD
jgi:hypothetical protein